MEMPAAVLQCAAGWAGCTLQLLGLRGRTGGSSRFADECAGELREATASTDGCGGGGALRWIHPCPVALPSLSQFSQRQPC
ncbi:unnamed protein product [Urochloa humidicola]